MAQSVAMPPDPNPKQWDWIRLSSGEWLGGSLELMRSDDLEFDSDELGMLYLDWDDVAELHSPRILTYRFETMGNLTGLAVMRGDSLIITSGLLTSKMPRSELIMIMEGQLQEKNFWSARVSLGIVTRSGNTEQKDLNVRSWARRLTPRSRGILEYAGNNGTVKDIETIDNHNLSINYDILVSRGFFINPFKLNLYRDPFQNMDLKSTFAAGVGYDLMSGGDVEWTVGLSGGFQSTRYVSVEAGEDDRIKNGTIIAHTNLDWEMSGNIDCRFDYNVQVGVPDVSNAFHHAQLTFEMDLLGDFLDLDLSLVWDRVESPTPDAESNTPERDDFRTTIGFGLDF